LCAVDVNISLLDVVVNKALWRTEYDSFEVAGSLDRSFALLISLRLWASSEIKTSNPNETQNLSSDQTGTLLQCMTQALNNLCISPAPMPLLSCDIGIIACLYNCVTFISTVHHFHCHMAATSKSHFTTNAFFVFFVHGSVRQKMLTENLSHYKYKLCFLHHMSVTCCFAMLIAKTFCFSRNVRFFTQGNSTHKFSRHQSVHQVQNRNGQHRFSICTKSRNVQKVTTCQHNEKMLQNLHCLFSVACIHHGMSASHKSSVCLVAVVSARSNKLHLANNFQSCFWIMHVKSIKSFKR